MDSHRGSTAKESDPEVRHQPCVFPHRRDGVTDHRLTIKTVWHAADAKHDPESIGNAGIRRIDAERGCQGDEMVLFLY